MSSSDVPPNIMAPKRPLPTGSASFHSFAGLLYQSTRVFCCANKLPVIMTKNKNRIGLRNLMLIWLRQQQLLLLSGRMAEAIQLLFFPLWLTIAQQDKRLLADQDYLHPFCRNTIVLQLHSFEKVLLLRCLLLAATKQMMC